MPQQNAIAWPPQGGVIKTSNRSYYEFNPKYYREGVLYKLYMWACIATVAGLILFLTVIIGSLLSLWSWWWFLIPAYLVLVSQVCLKEVTEYTGQASIDDLHWHGFGRRVTTR